MENNHENILYKSHQHIIVLVYKMLKVIFFSFLLSIILYFVIGLVYSAIIFFILVLVSYFYFYFFWSKSYFVITNKQVSLAVRNGFFSSYQMTLNYNQMKDTAFSKNNLFHYLFNYGTLFTRSSATRGEFVLKYVKNVEKVFELINHVYSLPQAERDKLVSIEQEVKEEKLTKEQIIEKEKNVLLGTTGIREVYLLNGEDKKFIFENEEDRNHGVYETIKRQVVFCATHDSSFRDPDASIVFKVGKKVIFPATGFREIKEKNVAASSPGVEVHNYLIKKLKNYNPAEDATLLIGFDI